MPDDAFRSDGGQPVDSASARVAWSRAARPFLVQVARRYGSLTTPNDLAEEVQALSGVRTREPADQWIGDVLEDIAMECGERGEPLLSAFCVGPDGRIGEPYEQLVVHLNGSTPVDIEMHAASQRLEAHSYHGAIMPVDGGRPTLPPQLAKERAAAVPKRTPAARAPSTRTPSTRVKKAPVPRKPKKPELPARAVCPTCFLQLPVNGRCDNCDD